MLSYVYAPNETLSDDPLFHVPLKKLKEVSHSSKCPYDKHWVCENDIGSSRCKIILYMNINKWLNPSLD